MCAHAFRVVPAMLILLTGLERTDNGMKLTSWPDVVPINQKNYYTFVYPYPQVR